MKFRSVIGALLLAGLALSADPPSPVDAAAITVNMQNFFFSTNPKTVTISDSISWVNGSGAPHTATNRARGDANAGDQWDHFVGNGSTSPSFTFNTVGTFLYHCRFHFGMDGTIVVNAAPTATPVPTSIPPPTPTPAPTAVPTATATPAPTSTPVPVPAVVPTVSQWGLLLVGAVFAVALLRRPRLDRR